jgi:threonine aldolase
VLLFLHDPAIEPTNNRGERTLREAVIVRKLSHDSKNERGAEAFAGFASVIQTAAKNCGCSLIDALQNLFQSKSHEAPTKAHPPPLPSLRRMGSVWCRSVPPGGLANIP